jgi:hypothetical protein
LIDQGAVSVTIKDVDSLILSIPDKQIYNVIDRKQSLEKNILTILNINTVYSYVENESLLEDPLFESIEIESEINHDLVSLFVNEYGYLENEIIENLNQFLYKKAVFRTFIDYSKQIVDTSVAEELANEYYLINKKKYLVEEKRDLSIIRLRDSTEDITDVNKILNELANDEGLFSEYAVKYSADPSVKSNSGNLGEFKKTDIKLTFIDSVFSKESTGLINEVYQDKGYFYIVKINKIIPSRTAPFDDVKEGLIKDVIERQSNLFVQKIINGSTEKLQVNETAAAAIFERYDFLKSHLTAL